MVLALKKAPETAGKEKQKGKQQRFSYFDKNRTFASLQHKKYHQMERCPSG